ncbi:MAG: HDOD domain-containing protein [Nitrospirae bacterium]|nr:HDOD domain-containing protein [Nitrospirota bacterium]
MNTPRESKIDTIKSRLQSSEDFPALSKAVMMVSQKSSKCNDFSVNDLTCDILNDISITNKLLRAVNSFAYVSSHTSGRISTITRAVFVAGFDRVRSIALSILLFENIHDKVVAEYLKEDVFNSFISGVFAREMASSSGIVDTESVFIYALFHKLGKLLTTFLLPIETIEIRKLVKDQGMREKQAVLNVMGNSFEEIGMEIARIWNFSQEMIQTMRSIDTPKVDEPRTPQQARQAIVCFANEISDMLTTDDNHLKKNFLEVLKRYENCFTLTNEKLKKIVEIAIKELSEYSSFYHNKFQLDNFLKRTEKIIDILNSDDFFNPIIMAPAIAGEQLTEPGETCEEEEIEELGDLEGEEAYYADEPRFKRTPSKTPYREMPENAGRLLQEGIHSISKTITGEFSFNELLGKILEIMYESVGFSRVLFCVKNAKEPIMEARFGHAKDIKKLIASFRFRLDEEKDIFNLAISRGSDVLIEDVSDTRIEQSLPKWYRELIDAQTFLLLPVIVDKKPIGIIYADKQLAGDMRLSSAILRSLSVLRDQVIELIVATRKRHNEAK